MAPIRLLIAAGLVALAPAGSATAGGYEGWVSREPKDGRLRAPSPPAAPTDDGAGACLHDLLAAGGDAEAADAPPPQAGCEIRHPVRLAGIRVGGATIRLSGSPLLACDFSRDVVAFVREIAEPLARAGLGRRLVALQVGGGYECRPRNRIAGGKPSAHGQGLALDISAFGLEGGGRIAVSAGLEGSEAAYVAALRKAACGYFTTVLGPGADAAHADHLHLDAEPRGRTGQSRFCQ